MRVDPAPQQQQDVEMLVEVSGEPASANCGADAVADDEERTRWRLRAEGASEARSTKCKISWTKTKARLGPQEEPET